MVSSLDVHPNIKIHELTDDEIKNIIESCAQATEFSIKSGYDGEEINDANIFLIQRFY